MGIVRLGLHDIQKPVRRCLFVIYYTDAPRLAMLSFNIIPIPLSCRRYLYDGSVAEYPELCWAWTGTIVGPFAYVMAAVHALCWRRSNAALGSVVSHNTYTLYIIL